MYYRKKWNLYLTLSLAAAGGGEVAKLCLNLL